MHSVGRDRQQSMPLSAEETAKHAAVRKNSRPAPCSTTLSGTRPHVAQGEGANLGTWNCSLNILSMYNKLANSAGPDYCHGMSYQAVLQRQEPDSASNTLSYQHVNELCSLNAGHMLHGCDLYK